MVRARDHCIRCGECCLKSSPSFQMQDLSLIRANFIKRKDIFTIRKGELVRDNINNALIVTRIEMMKVKERGGQDSGCILYNEEEKACTIYEKRPVQCSVLKCWDTREFMTVCSGPKPTRKDVIEDRVLLGIIEEHEKRCSFLALGKTVKQIDSQGEKAIEKIIDLLKFDFHLRPFISEKLGLNSDEMDFIFGRPVVETIVMFGLEVIREPDGSFFLTPIKSSNEG